jgi:hypothetical protein
MLARVGGVVVRPSSGRTESRSPYGAWGGQGEQGKQGSRGLKLFWRIFRDAEASEELYRFGFFSFLKRP